MIGITFGTWDLCHPGHLFLFNECKKRCDYLIVGLHSDPSIERKQKNKPIETIFERWKRLDSCKFIDKIIPYDIENDICNILRTEQIDCRFTGEEYQNQDFTAKKLCHDLNIRIEYIPRLHDWSSTLLRMKIKEN